MQARSVSFWEQKLHLIRSVSITTGKFKFCENKGTKIKQKLCCGKSD